MDADRHEHEISDHPEVVAEEMTGATSRLRDRAWMLAGFTRLVSPTADAASGGRGSRRRAGTPPGGR